MNKKIYRKVFCTIAGSDSGGGAGIQADIKTAESLGLFATSVITAITSQNPEQVADVSAVDPEIVRSQLHSVFDFFEPVAWKSGMLTGSDTIGVISEFLAKQRNIAKPKLSDPINPVEDANDRFYILDPVMIASSGARLVAEADVSLIKKELLPQCSIATPNADEAVYLTGLQIRHTQDQKQAARKFYELFGCPVLLKGGHLAKSPSQECIDVFYDGFDFLELPGPYIEGVDSHGSGCSYSSALASYLGLGFGLKDALLKSRLYMTHLFEQAWCQKNRPKHRYLNHQFLE